MKKMKYRIWCIMAAIVVGFLFPLTVLANPFVDYSKNGTGTLEICFETDDTKPVAIEGAGFTIYLVERLVEDEDGTQLLEWTDEFASCGILLENLTTSQVAEVAQKLAQYAGEQNIEGTTQATDQYGYTTFKNLKFGTYLVVLTKCPTDYWTIKPFLISVPNEDVKGNTVYDVSANPKTWKSPSSDEPDTPDEPDDPDTPDTPDPPDTPDEPDTPDTPDGPDTPDAPDTPDPPDTPDEPDTPDPPDTPDEPDTPDTPDEPDTPDTPDTPDNPDTPATPDNPKLPQTGHTRWLPPALFVISLIFFAIGWKIFKKKTGNILMFGGVCLFLAMLFVVGYQNYDEHMSNQAVDEMCIAYEKALEKEDESEGSLIHFPEKAEGIPFVEVEDVDCIGAISIPAIDITLPVGGECTRSDLRKVPCRYVGDANGNSLVIAAHNYDRHFGNLTLLQNGDQVKFTDVQGKESYYEVKETEILGAYDVDQMVSGDWDLTLFTCTYGGEKRITVRCTAVVE